MLWPFYTGVLLKTSPNITKRQSIIIYHFINEAVRFTRTGVTSIRATIVLWCVAIGTNAFSLVSFANSHSTKCPTYINHPIIRRYTVSTMTVSLINELKNNTINSRSMVRMRSRSLRALSLHMY